MTTKNTIASNWFFGFIVALFLFQTLWIAFSSVYPMIFDEEYHLGIIDIYSRQISPFIATQPTEAAFHGDITRYGSYLFHYIMSGPYRAISYITSDLQTIVIFMRLICIGFVVGGLFLFRAFLLRAGLTKGLSHLAIAFFTAIPLVPFATSQLSYDSLAFLLIALIFYITIRTIDADKKQIVWIASLLSVSALASLVKFTILPIALATALLTTVVLIRRHGKKLPQILLLQIKKLPRTTLIISSLFLIFSIGMFTERYGVNIVQYRTIEPKCDRIHSDESCIQYTVWRRDTTWKQANDAKAKIRDNPIDYTTSYWAPHIFNDFFVSAALVHDHDQPLKIRHLPTTMQSSAGNPVLRYGGWAILVLAIVALAITWSKLPNRKLRYLTLITVLVYASALWLRNYSDYLNIGAGTAAQGRYFIPLLIPIFAVVGLAFRHILNRMRYQVAFLFLCLVLLSQGGGVASYVLYSNSRWYWPENRQTITDINQSARKFLRSFTVL